MNLGHPSKLIPLAYPAFIVIPVDGIVDEDVDVLDLPALINAACFKHSSAVKYFLSDTQGFSLPSLEGQEYWAYFPGVQKPNVSQYLVKMQP